MAKYLCDSCTKRARESDGIYTRCRYMGDTKKRIECSKYVDENVVIKKSAKVDLLAWCGV